MALTLKERIAHEAEDLGFAAVRFASADPPQGAGIALDAFLADGRHGDMTWLAANSDRRKSPRAIWPEVKSIIMLGLSYGPERDPLEVLGQRSRGAISVYAQGADYHDVIKAKLKTLAARVQGFAPGDVKIFVDTAPVMEKPIAAKAGLGWQGKHTNLVSRDFGSWLFLGAIFTTSRSLPMRQSRIIAAVAAVASMCARPRPSSRPISSMRAPASPTSPSSIRDISRRSFVRPWATASSAVTIASPCVPGTNSRVERAWQS